MYLCYMDESGDPGVHPGSPTPTYTVSALFVHETEWVSIFDNLIAFRRYLRDSFGIRMRAEIKATQLVRGSGPWSTAGLGDNARKRIFRAFMRFQQKNGAEMAYAVVVDKSNLATTSEVRERAWRYALQRVERTMNARSERVMIVPDAGQYHWMRQLSREMRRHSTVGSLYGGGGLARPLLNVLIDDPVERQSHESYFIQLADLNAYAAYRYVVPTPGFPSTMWQELGGATLRRANWNAQRDGVVRG